LRGLAAACCLLLLVGCASGGSRLNWGAHLPSGKPLAHHLGSAAKKAVLTPETWVPLVLAAGLAIDDWDDQSSRWAARKQPLFGDDADDVSDNLRDVATAAYFITALAAPSERWQDKVSGLSVGVGTMLLEGGLSEGLKSAASRQRPKGGGDRSFPSGHAGQAASRGALARRNLAYLDVAPWQRRALEVSLHGVAIGSAWARVEAEKHHTSDVLVGMALGNFVANFMHNAFMEPSGSGLALRFAPVAGGGVLRLSLILD
jgi:hypothetical protein